ncbi:hypothetical protein C8R46DRAFT_1075973 [Mycena filopes]|nr:hypothetical protein C8R46DRAFT_1075973 [Mycena filopes]
MSDLTALVQWTVGPLVLGIVFHAIFFGIICTSTFHYYAVFARTDCHFRRNPVATLLLLNTFQSGTFMDIVFRAATWFESDGTPYFFAPQNWTMCIQPATTAVIVFVAHLTLVGHSRAVSKGAWGVLAFLGPLILLSLGAGLACSVLLFKVGKLSDVGRTGSIALQGWLISMLLFDLSFLVQSWVVIRRSGLDANKTLRARALNSAMLTFLTVLTTVFVDASSPTTATFYLMTQFSIGPLYTLRVLMSHCVNVPAQAPALNVPDQDIQGVTFVDIPTTDAPTQTAAV